VQNSSTMATRVY